MSVSRELTLYADSGEELSNLSRDLISGFTVNASQTTAGAPLQNQDYIDKVAARAQHVVDIDAMYWAADNPFLTSAEEARAMIVGSPNIGDVAIAGDCSWPRVRFAAPADGVISNSAQIISRNPWTYGRVIGRGVGISSASVITVQPWGADEKLWFLVYDLVGGSGTRGWTLSDDQSSAKTSTISFNAAGIVAVNNPGASKSSGGKLTPTGLTSSINASFVLVAGKEADF